LHAGAKLGEQLLHALVRQVWVLLGAGEDELLGSDGLVEDEPAISHPGAPNMAQRREVIAARDEVIGQPLARRVQPHRAGTRDDANTVARPNGVPVVHALRVVPGPVGVHEVRTRSFGDADHAAVHVGRHAGDHVLRGGPPAVSRPALAHQVEVSANSAGSDDGARCTEFELPRGRSGGCLAARKVRCFQDCAAHAFDAGAPVGPGTGDQLIDAVAELEAEAALLLHLLDLLAEDADDLRPRPPGQMEAWHAVAVTGGVAGAALGPTDGGQNVEPQVLEVAALLVGGKADVSRPQAFGQRSFGVSSNWAEFSQSRQARSSLSLTPMSRCSG